MIGTRHLNGLLRPSEGEVRLEGAPVSKDLARARQMVGMVFQDADSQIVGEIVYDDASFGPENLRLDRDEISRRVTGALNAVGLTHLSDHRPHLLSGGEKRRLGSLPWIPGSSCSTNRFPISTTPGPNIFLLPIFEFGGRLSTDE